MPGRRKKKCPYFKKCSFVCYLRRPEIWEMIAYLFCDADFYSCKRFQRREKGESVPNDLWPTESISVSEILESLNFNFRKILEEYHDYFVEFEQSDEYWVIFEEGIVKKLKERFGAQIQNLLTFFGRYYEDLFLGDFNQSFFIEMAYFYEKVNIEDSIFDSAFLVFVSTLEEAFIKWAENKGFDPEKKAILSFNFARINTLGLMLLKKTIKLFQEIKALYTSKKQLSEIKAQLYIDELTKAYNRKFLEFFAEELKRRYKYVIFLDIDHFKKINDTYGHAAGDKVLREVVKVLKRKLRKDDVVIRYGGEEFVVLINCRNLEEAAIVAEKLRKAIEKHHFSYEDRPIRVTISLGVCSISKNKPLCKSLEKADKALYKAKEEGRNRVEVIPGEENNSSSPFIVEHLTTFQHLS